LIILHFGETELWLDPSKIVVVTDRTDRPGVCSDVYTVESNECQSVRETPAEVARLKYAWGAHHPAEVHLPETHKIAIELVDDVITARYGDICHRRTLTMLRLTRHGFPIFLPAEHIVAILPVVIDRADQGCDVKTLESGTYSGSYRVEESALDVARLKAAWERRYTVARIAEYGELPIAAYLTTDGYPSFLLCKKTAERNAEARAARGDEDPPMKDIVGREIEMAAAQDFAG
jgi:hypothetical protein